MKHFKSMTRLPLSGQTGDANYTGTPLEAKLRFLVDLVDRGVTWAFQKGGGAL